MNGYNFTERVRKVLQFAREEADRLRHEYVGTEHILLGLIREGQGVASSVLLNLGVDAEVLRQKIEETVKPGRAAPGRGRDLPYTSRAKKVLELAMAEARDISHSYVGTEHLLLGLIREEKGIGGQVLLEAGVTLERARQETLRLLGAPDQAAAGPQPPGGEATGRTGTDFIAVRGREPRRVDIEMTLRFPDGTSHEVAFANTRDAIAYLASL